MKANEIKAVLVKANEKAVITTVENTLESYQHIVGGYIECVYPYEENVAIICNEEGKIDGLPLNRALCDDCGEIYDIIAGTFVIVGISDDCDFTSLTDDQARRYKRMFYNAECFIQENGRIRVIECPEIAKEVL